MGDIATALCAQCRSGFLFRQILFTEKTYLDLDTYLRPVMHDIGDRTTKEKRQVFLGLFACTGKMAWNTMGQVLSGGSDERTYPRHRDHPC